MNWIYRKLIKFFFNRWYKLRPPETVKYYKNSDKARAIVTYGESGEVQMKVEGEKYNMQGFPRGHVLYGTLAKMKQKVKDLVFNQAFAEIEKIVEEGRHDVLPESKMPVAVKEIFRVLENMEEMEVTPDMRGRIRLIRKVITFFLSEDDAYRHRAQYFLSHLDQKKIKLTDADLYYARAKYWKPDIEHYDY